jgi:hypothetical protein
MMTSVPDLTITVTSAQGREIVWKCVDARERRERTAYFRSLGYTVLEV